MKGDAKREPIYSQLVTVLRGEIESGELGPGDRLPTEAALCARFSVSRITVRQALDDLASMGLIAKVQGKGTFVKRQMVEKPLVRFMGFAEEMTEHGRIPATEVIDLSIVLAMRDVRSALALPDDGQVIRFERIRMADGLPMVYKLSYLPYYIFKGLLAVDLARTPLYDAMGQMGYRPWRADETLEVGLAGKVLARFLGCPAGTPLVTVRGLVSSETGKPVECVKSCYRGDLYSFKWQSSR